jgi:hypothetical protein
MVSTRRSRSAGGESEQIVSTIGSQDDVSSKHAAAQPLDPISEEPAAPTPARRRRGVSQQQQQQQQLAQIQEQQQQQRDAPAHDLSEQAMQQQLQVEPAAGQQQSQPPAMQRSDDSSSEEEDDDLDFDFDGPGVLQNLAAAIRSGFQSQGQQQRQAPAPQQQQQQQQPRGSLQAAAAAAATAARSSGRELNDDELQQLRWRPHTGLQVPAQAAAAVALVRPMYTKRGQRQQQLPQDEHIGALVEPAPAAAADGAGASSSGLQQSGAAAVAAAGSKPAGLSKALHAPTLDAAARAKESKKTAPDTAGSKWFDLPAPKITEELKRDLRVLRLRGAYDTKRFYKSFDNTKFPKYFAVGCKGSSRAWQARSSVHDASDVTACGSPLNDTRQTILLCQHCQLCSRSPLRALQRMVLYLHLCLP